MCDCGNKIIVSSSRLNKGRIKTCGCHKGENFKKHGFYGTRIHRIWTSMRERCDKNVGTYSGITYCDDWKEFIPFYEWAIKNGYADNLTLDRIDVYGNYSAENCRWVTQKVQQNNRRNNTIYKFGEEIHTLSEWSDITGISRSTISARILKLKWSVEKALTTPVKGGKT